MVIPPPLPPATKDPIIVSKLKKGMLGYSAYILEKKEYPNGGTKIYPPGVIPVTVSSSNQSDVFGSWNEIIPANTIEYKYSPTNVYVADVSDDTRTYILELGYGLESEEVSIGKLVLNATEQERGLLQLSFKTQILDANSRLAGRLKTNENVVNTADIFIGYIEFPSL